MPNTLPGAGVTLAGGTTTSFFAEILNIDGATQTREPIETTHSLSAAKTFLPSVFVDGGEVTVELNFDQDEVPPIGAVTETWTVTYPLPPGQVTAATDVFDGFLTAVTPAIPIEDRMTQTVTIKVTGAVVRTPSAAT